MLAYLRIEDDNLTKIFHEAQSYLGLDSKEQKAMEDKPKAVPDEAPRYLSKQVQEYEDGDGNDLKAQLGRDR